MGFETRRGNLYYYRKRREGGRVVSEYIGVGHVAVLCSQLDAAERAEAQASRARERGGREAEEVLDGLLDTIGAVLRTAAGLEMIGAGCHNHRGQWRVIRGGTKG